MDLAESGGQDHAVKARVVVNAAGAWIDKVNWVLGIDSRLMGARVARLAAALGKLGATPEVVRQKYGRGGWYYAQDWRGKQGQLPGEAAVRETWGKWAAEPVSNDRYVDEN